MTDLYVDTDGLSGFSSRLRAIRDQMNANRALLDRYAGDIGSADVVAALEDFEDNWKDGRARIDKDLAGLADMADNVVKQLIDVDVKLARKLLDLAGDGVDKARDTVPTPMQPMADSDGTGTPGSSEAR